MDAQIFPEDVLLDEVATAAKARGMHLITDGRRVVVSPVVPPGFFKVAVKIKSAQHAHMEVQPCAA